MSKFQVNNRPLMHPGKCAGCFGSSEDGRQYVDLCADVAEYLSANEGGSIYLCSFCIKELARLLFPELFERPTPPPPVEKKDDIRETLNSILEVVNGIRSDRVSDSDYSDSTVSEESVSETVGESEREDDGDESTASGSDSGSYVPSLAELLESRSSK